MAHYNQETLATYVLSSLELLPFVFIVLAFNMALAFRPVDSQLTKLQNVEIYVFVLVVSLFLVHLIGINYSLGYIVGGGYQPTTIIIWSLASIVFTLFITTNKSKRHTYLKTINSQQAENIHTLNKQNVALHTSILHSEEKAIVSSSNNAILTTSPQGMILSANPAAVHLFQRLEHEIVGNNIELLFSSKEKMHHFFKFDSNLYNLQRQDKGLVLECDALRSDGINFPVQVELQWTERNEKPLVVITFINLTARKLAEKQALDLKDKFIANISHEFRTPLTIINGILERYLTTTIDKAQLQELTTAKRNGLRLVRMVEQLLELSRLSHNPSLTLSTYRLKTLMHMPLDSFKKLAAQHDLTFEAEIPNDYWLECDPQAFEKIVFNLLANAVKYTPAGGNIEVKAFLENDQLHLAVIDTGIGISQANKEKIFERFQRADDIKNNAIFGVGIGLSLVNELVKAHHWRISLVSEYKKGSKFTLSMPIAKPLAEEFTPPSMMSDDEVSSLLTDSVTITNEDVNHSQKIVLVIEDNKDMQSHIKQIIEQQHHCVLALSGELGLSLAQEYIPDLIVCDIMLTGIDGFDVLQQLKQNELTSHIPVIMLTARSDLESRIKGLNLQADEYLSKPFNQKELLVRIENLIANRDLLQENYYQKFKLDSKKELKDKNVSQGLAKIASPDQGITVNDKFLEKLSNIVTKLYVEPELDIKILSKELAVSERQLQRKLKVLLGTTPNNYIKEFRLKKAEELLKSGNQIGLIALDVGFSSQTYFGRCFKEKYKCTPKQYQAKYLT
ncbi:response regulator [Thalassotalea sp. M1531]|uniref:histidine kinase n=1 Tax=Thalassotalea algicola TaxID=2716224 RepID=A0A7Y0LFT4_9GAMM|nr:ATP-binding protein [Thalassotalea algicola]NMP32410.1 response regulator [Thalassotalea algicola]